MAANRFSWMRVVQATDPAVIKMARSDEDANGLSLASRRLTLPQAKKLVQVFLAAKPSAGARHKRRQKQLAKLR
jgi:ribose 5-phosphate isomerase RpiB